MLRSLRLSGQFNSAPALPVATTRTPSVSSPFCCAYDITNDRVLYDKDANVVYDFPASTIKVMTCLLVAEIKATSLSDTIAWQTSDDLAAGFSQVGFANGDVVTWTDLLHSMLMVSGGDACQLAARILGNEDAGNAATSTAGYARFNEMMNDRAVDLGCTNARFTNSHGAEYHPVSARDMAVISGACFKNTAIDGLARDTSYAISVTGPSPRTINLSNANSVLSTTGVKGSKTGSLSGGIYPTVFNLVTLWTSTGGVDVAIATFGAGTSTDRYDDTTDMIASLPTDFPYLV